MLILDCDQDTAYAIIMLNELRGFVAKAEMWPGKAVALAVKQLTSELPTLDEDERELFEAALRFLNRSQARG